MNELEEIAKIIKSKNRAAGDALEQLLEDKDIKSFNKILNNFIRFNYEKEAEPIAIDSNIKAALPNFKI